MDCFLKVLRMAFLCAVIIGQAGCATTEETTNDTLPSDATPSTADSHGWGTSIQNAGR